MIRHQIRQVSSQLGIAGIHAVNRSSGMHECPGAGSELDALNNDPGVDALDQLEQKLARLYRWAGVITTVYFFSGLFMVLFALDPSALYVHQQLGSLDEFRTFYRHNRVVGLSEFWCRL